MIIGAGGFLGRGISQALATDGWKVLAATRQPTDFGCSAITNHTGIFDSPDILTTLLDSVDVIIHAASLTTPSSSAGHPSLELQGNLAPTFTLVDALQRHPEIRLIFLSSGGTVYGPSTTPASELSPIRPRSYYGAAKAAAEHLIQSFSTQFSTDAVILRPSNIYGPKQSSRAGFAVVPTALERIRTGTPMMIWGDGNAVRDYLYIDDLIDAVQCCLTMPMEARTRIYNISSGSGVSVTALLDTIEHVTAQPLLRRYQCERTVDVPNIVLNNAAASIDLGWHPKVNLEAGLALTWEWFRTA